MTNMIQWKEIEVELEAQTCPTTIVKGNVTVPVFLKTQDSIPSIGCIGRRNPNTGSIEYDVINGEWSFWIAKSSQQSNKTLFKGRMHTPSGERRIEVVPCSFVELIQRVGEYLDPVTFGLYRSICESNISYEQAQQIRKDFHVGNVTA